MPYFSETISKISDPYAFNIVNLEPPSTIVKYQMPLTYELATNSDISMHEEYFRGNKLIIQRNLDRIQFKARYLSNSIFSVHRANIILKAVR